MPSSRITRRAFPAAASGTAAGVFATPLLGGAAQDASAATDSATPVAITTPVGFVSTRIRTLESPDVREQINELVLDRFITEVEALEGFEGYVLGDVIEEPAASLSILVLEESSQTAGFGANAADFVGDVEESITTVATVQWEGELLISAGPSTGVLNATPAATPAAQSISDGYIAMRVHTSTPGMNPRDFIPLATSSFLPLLYGLPGFMGYLWYPTDGGFVAISLFDSEASAEASNEIARDWAAEFLTEYTDGNPEIVNASVIYANLPILGAT